MKTAYEGENPLKILLELLNKDSLEITNFSLAEVADAYLSYVQNLRDRKKDLENISEFISVASKLVLIKSRFLLSQFEKEEEIEEVNDLREKLLEYKKFKEASLAISELFKNSKPVFSRKSFLSRDLEMSFTKNDLRKAFENIVKNFNFEEGKLEESKKEISTIKIEQKIFEIKNLLKKMKEISFSKMFFNKKNKLETIISFLSVLELFKQGEVELNQNDNFKELKITRI